MEKSMADKMYEEALEKLKVSTAYPVKPLSAKEIVKLAMSEKDIENAKAFAEPEPEEWIWVEGYKGTDKNMVCRDFKFEMNKQFDMPEGAEIKDCESGFHLCVELGDVFTYYRPEDGNRFFRVRALVRKKDYEECNMHVDPYIGLGVYVRRRNKLASKSIVFLYELTADEILKDSGYWHTVKDYTEQEKAEVLMYSFETVKRRKNSEKLVAAGYSQGFAEYIAYDLDSDNTVDIACKVASQPGLSMDMKALMILRHHYDD